MHSRWHRHNKRLTARSTVGVMSQDKLNGISFEKGCYVGQVPALL